MCGACGSPLMAQGVGYQGSGPPPPPAAAGLGNVQVGGAAATAPNVGGHGAQGGAPPTAFQGGGHAPVGRGHSPRTRVAEEAPKPVAGWLVVLRSRHVQPYVDLALHEGRNEIGRDPGPLQLADPRASGRHAMAVARDGEVMLTDLSQNGTVVNNQMVQSHALQAGDMVKIGGTTLVYVPFPQLRG